MSWPACLLCGRSGVDLIENLCDRCYVQGGGPPGPSVEDYCASGDHGYEGDEWETTPESLAAVGDTAGRCYCGKRRYPAGGDDD